MYITQLNNRRFTVDVIFETVATKGSMCMVFDTGAEVTCLTKRYSASLLSCARTGNVVRVKGIVRSSALVLQGVLVPMLSVGDLVLYNKEVFITNDDRMTMNLLGIDIIQDLDFMYSGESKSLIVRYPVLNKVPVNMQQVAVDKILKDRGVFTTEARKVVIESVPRVDMPFAEFEKCVLTALRIAELDY